MTVIASPARSRRSRVATSDWDRVLAALKARDGRRITGQDLAGRLKMQEQEVRTLLGEARRAGQARM